jgi:hypothetical protein
MQTAAEVRSVSSVGSGRNSDGLAHFQVSDFGSPINPDAVLSVISLHVRNALDDLKSRMT